MRVGMEIFMKTIKVGLIGAGHRGVGLIGSILASDNVEVVAVADLYEERVEKAKAEVKRISGKEPLGYSDGYELIKSDEVEAVVVASYWEEHVNLAVAAMRAGKYTAVEVAGAYDVEDCWMLVRTYEETKTPIMFLENCCFGKFELTSTALARCGKFGRIVYCHGAYSHELLGEILGGDVDKHYRLRNYEKRNCENYPTHEIGPIAKLLNITRGNKFLTLSSQASKSGVGICACIESDKCPDKNQAGKDFNQGDIVFTTIKCQNGELVTIKLDTTLPRYYSREFTVRGTKGFAEENASMFAFADDENLHECFNSAKFLEDHMGNIEKYSDYIPDVWKNITSEQLEVGHDGIDCLEFMAFFKAIREGTPMPIDVYDMATWMVITPLTEQSIALGGAPVAFPDFTRGKWILRAPEDVVELPKPKECKTCESKATLGFGRS